MSDRDDNLRTARDIYAAFGNGDIPAMLTLLADDIEWEHPGPSEIPWAGSFRGHDGVVSFFTAITDNADFIGFEPQTFLSDGDRGATTTRSGTERSRTFESSRTRRL